MWKGERERERVKDNLGRDFFQTNVYKTCHSHAYEVFGGYIEAVFTALCLVPLVFGLKSDFLVWKSSWGAADTL